MFHFNICRYIGQVTQQERKSAYPSDGLSNVTLAGPVCMSMFAVTNYHCLVPPYIVQPSLITHVGMLMWMCQKLWELQYTKVGGTIVVTVDSIIYCYAAFDCQCSMALRFKQRIILLRDSHLFAVDTEPTTSPETAVIMTTSSQKATGSITHTNISTAKDICG